MKTISVVTVNRNNRSGLSRTLRSIGQQRSNADEVIVVDGRSTDGSDEVIARFSETITHAALDRGEGIYSAMNQGVNLSSCDYVIFINSGDCFFDDSVIEEVRPLLRGDLCYGSAWLDGENEAKRYLPLDQLELGMPFSHQALFTKRECLLETPFSSQFPIGGDYYFILSSVRKGYSLQELPVNVALLEPAGVSGNAVAQIWERYRMVASLRTSFATHRYYWKCLTKAWRQRIG